MTAAATSRLSLVRLGRNEALARRGGRKACGDERLRFRCECGRADCRETVQLTRREYQYLRRQPGATIVVPSHRL